MANGTAVGAFIRFREQVAHSVPPAGFRNIWIDASGNAFQTDSAGVDTAFGGGVGLGNTSPFTKAQGSAPHTYAYASPLTIDASLSNSYLITLTGALVLNAPTGLKAGYTYIIRLKQDATGGRALTSVASAFRFPGGTLPSLTATANAVDIITGYSPDGTIIECTFQAAFAVT